MNVSLGKKLCVEGCARKERSGIAWSWQLKEGRRNTDKGRCPLCLGEEDTKHTILDWFEVFK
jgi:hypothetical protein